MDETKARISARNMLTAFLEGKRLRKTPERYAILDKVLELSAHFDIMSLYREMEQDSYHVSRATIYNTMELLCNCSLVRKHQFGTNKQSLYEKVISTGNHHHLICTECGKIKEVKDLELIHLIGDRKYGSFSVSYISLYVYGVCATCRRKKRKSKTTK